MNAREWSLRIAELLRRERSSVVDVLLALAEFDRLAMYRELGFASLFDFLHRELGLSRGMAHYRLVATRLVERYPEVIEPLRDGRLCLSSVVELARVITDENRSQVLPRFFEKSRQEAKEVAAELLPTEVVPARTVVTGARSSSTVELEPVAAPSSALPAAVERRASPVPRTTVEPLTRQATRMHVTVSPEFVRLLERARKGQSHVQPGATDEQVLTAALELLIAQQERRRASVPPKVKREVRKRDGGRCTWPLSNGGTCGSEVRTEIDHVLPRGKGGPSTVENCRVLCDVHNRESARRVYGDAHMDQFAPRLPRASEPVAAWGSLSSLLSPPFHSPPARTTPHTTPGRGWSRSGRSSGRAPPRA